MDLELKGKTAVVTGADSGMGLATAAILLAEGARVVIADQDRARIDAAAASLGSADVHACVVDVTDLASVERLRDDAIAHLGHVDCLVNAAGVTGATGMFHEIDDAGWQETLDILLMGTVRVVRAFVPAMAARGAGRIVLFASEDSEQPYADEIPYCAAKAGIRALTKGLSKTYAKQGLLVNSVGPAFIATPMTDAMMEKRAGENGTSVDEAIRSFLAEERPNLELQRRGRAEEVAAVVAFLCSGHASFVNGANYRVDGGSVATI